MATPRRATKGISTRSLHGGCARPSSSASPQRRRCAPRGFEAFGRCVALRTAQWALDARKKLPSIAEFRAMLGDNAHEMIAGARALRASVEASAGRRAERSLIAIEQRRARRPRRPGQLRAAEAGPYFAAYPGVHVLYHRWQVDGRKEHRRPSGLPSGWMARAEPTTRWATARRPSCRAISGS